MTIDLTAIAELAGAIWLLTAVLKRLPFLAEADSQLVALAVTVVAGALAGGFGYLTGNPVAIAIQVIVAMFGANAAQDKIAAPVVKRALGK